LSKIVHCWGGGYYNNNWWLQYYSIIIPNNYTSRAEFRAGLIFVEEMTSEYIHQMHRAEEHVAFALSVGVRSSVAFREIQDNHMLSIDKNRCYLKRMPVKKYIEVFPWFSVHYKSKTHKFREVSKDFSLGLFREAIEYFCDSFKSNRVVEVISCFRSLYWYALSHPLLAVIKAHQMLAGSTRLVSAGTTTNFIFNLHESSSLDCVVGNCTGVSECFMYSSENIDLFETGADVDLAEDDILDLYEPSSGLGSMLLELEFRACPCTIGGYGDGCCEKEDEVLMHRSKKLRVSRTSLAEENSAIPTGAIPTGAAAATSNCQFTLLTAEV
jgi:hypothetical protein